MMIKIVITKIKYTTDEYEYDKDDVNDIAVLDDDNDDNFDKDVNNEKDNDDVLVCMAIKVTSVRLIYLTIIFPKTCTPIKHSSININCIFCQDYFMIH